MYNPRRKADRVVQDIEAGRKPGKDYTPAMRAYYKYRTGKVTFDPGSPEHAIFVEVRHLDFQSRVLKALIVGGCPNNVADEALGMPVGSMALFRELFFDISEFKTRLSLMTHIYDWEDGADYTEPPVGPQAPGMGLMRAAYEYGYEYILERFAGSGYFTGKDGGSKTGARLKTYLGIAAIQAAHRALVSYAADKDDTDMRANLELFAKLQEQYENCVRNDQE